MYVFEEMITLVDSILNTKKKRHILGGVLISVSVMFCGLAITTLTIRMEDDDDE